MIGYLASSPVLSRISLQILQQTKKNQVFFLLRFPKPGFFRLELYTLPVNDRSDSLPKVYTYLIDASLYHRPCGQVMPFPKQFQHWRHGCYLKTPIDGILGLDDNGRLSSPPPSSLPFNVRVPNAIAVAVVVGDEWTKLDSEGDHWKGNVHMKKHWGKMRKLAVCAKYSTNDTEYSPLLEYELAM
ncbi:unnamed protein product [Dibothriocephalus latus]|uniref:KY-like immunoglobulin-like domain-containing protein n=1 Tax=Dibothriocephalus latus TaxID=60516 RepID=A0A3P6R0C2_DIBLA|nr:unnamed protein product [Dibothriocephalus latus]